MSHCHKCILDYICICNLYSPSFALCYRNPNGPDHHQGGSTSQREKNRSGKSINWEEYDPVHQKYLEIGEFIFYTLYDKINFTSFYILQR